MKKIIFLTLILQSLVANAHSWHKSKPLSFEELPAVCQAFFTRADRCYSKAGERAALFKHHTAFMRGALPAATVAQREKICQMADESFAQKVKDLKCE